MRYVAFRWTPTVREEERSARTMARRLGAGWRVLIDWRGVLVLTHECETSALELPNGRGVIFGEAWAGAVPDASVEEDCARTIARLATERWGSYVAIVIDKGHDVVRVLRSPDGAVACFVTEKDNVSIVFADAEDIVAINPDIEPDWAFVAAFLCYPRVALRRTGLAGVDELAPGEAAVFTRTHFRIEAIWTPWRTREAEIHSFDEGARRLRAAAEQTAETLAARARRILHRLSGGFDSSIVLGLIARFTPPEAITCVNEYWPGASEGDEREMARAVAEANGVRLIELAMDPRRVQYERLLDAPLTVKPTLAALSFADAGTIQAYGDVKAELLTSGRGGDHIFHRSRTASIAADAIRDGQEMGALLTTALDTARLTRRSVWGIFEAMLLEGALRRRASVIKRSSAAALLSAAPPEPELQAHPWLAHAKHAPPARAQRVGHLRDALSYHDRSASTGGMRAFPLLLAQPIVDVCLTIPPYVMTAGGRDRSLARAAFADLAPDRVMARTLKGETTRYFAAVLNANRNWICDALAHGELAQADLLDRRRFLDLVQSDWRQDAASSDGLYSLIAVEAWLRNLARCRRRAAAAQSAEAA